MIISNALLRVFHCQFAGQTGTMFTLDHDNRQYIVSAKHIFESANSEFQTDVMHDSHWKIMKCSLVGHSTTSDISVFVTDHLLSEKELVCPGTMQNLCLGQDVYFLGFPYGKFGYFDTYNRKFPTPFVKKATVAMVDIKSSNCLFLDGINNEGFSGGPVAFQANGNGAWQIAGVISSYLAVSESVELEGEDVGLRSLQNTGLIQVAPIQDAISIIENNPIGQLHP